MLTQIQLSESVGKTVRAVTRATREQVIVTFDDGTFALLYADADDGDGAELWEPPLDVRGVGDLAAVTSGIMTRGEVDAYWRERKAEVEEAERQQLRRLKEKYER